MGCREEGLVALESLVLVIPGDLSSHPRHSPALPVVWIQQPISSQFQADLMWTSATGN